MRYSSSWVTPKKPAPPGPQPVLTVTNITRLHTQHSASPSFTGPLPGIAEFVAELAESSDPLRIALVVPVRNEIQSIGLLLRSISAQTRQPDELVMVDAGSTDGTQAVI